MWFVGAPASLGREGAVPGDDAITLTRPGDRHLTLVFLGRIPEDVVMRVWDRLPPLVLPHVATGRRWERFGRSAIALVLADDDGSLARATLACVAVAEEVVPSFRPPSAFRPHVTFGRVRRGARPPTRAAMARWSVPADPVGLGPATLFRTRNGTDPVADRYEPVAQR